MVSVFTILWSVSALHRREALVSIAQYLPMDVCLSVDGHFSSARQENRCGQDEFLNVRGITDRWSVLPYSFCDQFPTFFLSYDRHFVFFVTIYVFI